MGSVKFREIIPREFDYRAIKKAVVKAANNFGQDVISDLNDIAREWEGEKPTFEVEVQANPLPQSIGLTVELSLADPSSMGGRKFIYLDQGTKPHVIRAKPGKTLAFQSGYTAKTVPGRLGSRRGGPSGKRVYAQKVQHPGIKPRQYFKTLAEKHEETFYKEIERGVRNGAKKTGHH
jgi:hypothetical protein